MNEVKSIRPIDLPLFRRLASNGLNLDIATQIQDSHALETAVLGVVGITGRGRPTYIMRSEAGDFAAQIQVEEEHARLLLLAPDPVEDHGDSSWLGLLDSVLEQAGRRGAHLVTAEVPVDSVALTLCRKAGFTVYSRQRLYYREPQHGNPVNPISTASITLQDAKHANPTRLSALYANTVPRMVQLADPAPQEWDGLAIYHEDRLRGYIGVKGNKHSALLQPYLHPELYDHIHEVFGLALAALPQRRLFLRLLAYQDWLRGPLEGKLGFSQQANYALMACHTTVFVKETSVFSALQALEGMSFVPGVEAKLEKARSGSQLMIKNLVQWDIELPTTSKN